MPLCDRYFYYPNARNYGSPEELGLDYEPVRIPTRDGLQLHGWFFPVVEDQNAAIQDRSEVSPSTSAPGWPTSSGGGGADDGRRPESSAPPRLKPRGTHSGQSEAEGPRWPTSASSVEPKPAARTRGTVLHLHGNAGNMSGHFQHVAWLPAAGWNVLCFDYRGYGGSRAPITRAGTVLDAHAALDYLLKRPDVDAKRIVAFGQSLGGAIGTVLAAERPELRGLAADGAFDSYQRVASWHIRHNLLLRPFAWWVPRVLMSNDHDPIDFVGRIAPRPVLIIHGTADKIVPVAMARSLYDAARDPKRLWLVDGADHYDPLREHGDEARSRLLAFFASCLSSNAE